jgi:uncharacterized protein (DUF488 family)
MNLYTLGHSNHPIERFLALLASQEIATLVDIRSTPASRFNPQYNRRRLEEALSQAGVQYIYLGNLLSGRPKDPALYVGGRLPERGEKNPPLPDFAKMMQRYDFQRGIEDLVRIAGGSRTAMACKEENPADCHRHRLVAAYLARSHPEVAVWHIRASGAVEDARLLGFG